MWRLLRENFPNGRWRRQVSLQHYIADIASNRLRIVIELDGGQHSAELELTRTRAIEGEGYQLLRFWNNEVLQNSCGCMERLALIIKQVHPNPASTRRQAAKSSHPSPIKGEEKT